MLPCTHAQPPPASFTAASNDDDDDPADADMLNLGLPDTQEVNVSPTGSHTIEESAPEGVSAAMPCTFEWYVRAPSQDVHMAVAWHPATSRPASELLEESPSTVHQISQSQPMPSEKTVSGSFVATQPGTLRIVISNPGSWLFSKKVQWLLRVTVESAEEGLGTAKQSTSSNTSTDTSSITTPNLSSE